MRAPSITLLIALVLGITGGQSSAGWEIKQLNYSTRSNDMKVAERVTTMRISKGRVRLVDDPITVLIDYTADRLTLLLPVKNIYWSGSSDDYLRELAGIDTNRLAPGSSPATNDDPPEIAVTQTTETGVIAGRKAVKYEIKLRGEPYQEVWVGDLKLDSDLDSTQLNAFEEKISQSRRGKNAADHAALARNPDYKNLWKKGFPLRKQSFLGKAKVGMEVQTLVQAAVDDDEFSVPEGYQRVPLANLFETRDDLSR